MSWLQTFLLCDTPRFPFMVKQTKESIYPPNRYIRQSAHLSPIYPHLAPYTLCALSKNTLSIHSCSTPSSASDSRAISYQLLDAARDALELDDPKIMRSKPNASMTGATKCSHQFYIIPNTYIQVHLQYILILRFHSRCSLTPEFSSVASDEGVDGVTTSNVGGRYLTYTNGKRESAAIRFWKA